MLFAVDSQARSEQVNIAGKRGSDGRCQPSCRPDVVMLEDEKIGGTKAADPMAHDVQPAGLLGTEILSHSLSETAVFNEVLCVDTARLCDIGFHLLAAASSQGGGDRLFSQRGQVQALGSRHGFSACSTYKEPVVTAVPAQP
jgi:hypothetical protein